MIEDLIVEKTLYCISVLVTSYPLWIKHPLNNYPINNYNNGNAIISPVLLLCLQINFEPFKFCFLKCVYKVLIKSRINVSIPKTSF